LLWSTGGRFGPCTPASAGPEQEASRWGGDRGAQSNAPDPRQSPGCCVAVVVIAPLVPRWGAGRCRGSVVGSRAAVLAALHQAVNASLCRSAVSCRGGVCGARAAGCHRLG
jgi:hypothetical protein